MEFSAIVGEITTVAVQAVNISTLRFAGSSLLVSANDGYMAGILLIRVAILLQCVNLRARGDLVREYSRNRNGSSIRTADRW